jgi:TolA-binding protein
LDLFDNPVGCLPSRFSGNCAKIEGSAQFVIEKYHAGYEKPARGARWMTRQGPSLFFCFFPGFLLISGYVFAQTPGYAPRTGPAYPAADPVSPAPQISPRLRNGIKLYGEGKWRDAVIELRRAQAEAPGPEQWAEALYWIGLAELSAGEYEAALRDMEELARTAPGSPRQAELPYHRGRAYYHLGRYDEAVVILKDYADRVGEGSNSRKSASLYWIGESLYALGQLDRARDVFALIVEQYPQSAKFEAAAYRLELINQKKIEVELLALLKWSHEESLRTMEEYQRRERSYDQALIAYQKRIADMLKDTRLADLETANANYRKQLAEAEERIRALEAASGRTAAPANTGLSSETTIHLLDLKARALELKGEMEKEVQSLESGGGNGAPGTGGNGGAPGNGGTNGNGTGRNGEASR